MTRGALVDLRVNEQELLGRDPCVRKAHSVQSLLFNVTHYGHHTVSSGRYRELPLFLWVISPLIRFILAISQGIIRNKRMCTYPLIAPPPLLHVWAGSVVLVIQVSMCHHKCRAGIPMACRNCPIKQAQAQRRVSPYR
jgi:hypothetical protein